ncbi:adenylate/guanylate cyclase domain-containing protein [Glaciecola sp. KUL10]|uniref:adenylate/guanylate cyclase domain-containing protein n=1 Tax=Glaciecola sp. (strain KUL10) TaxID=2161813 RepID=UPI000D787D8A|nr:adenylate/guanylate cyclase domain-containing protein [Glaciecola sp. KUL10]
MRLHLPFKLVYASVLRVYRYLARHQRRRFDQSDILIGIGFLLLITVITQSSKLLLIPPSIDKTEHFLNAIVHCVIFAFAIKLCLQKSVGKARTVLTGSFLSYITFACLLWQINLNIQYFYLLALFVTSYLYGKDKDGHIENLEKWLWSTLSITLFLYFQTSLPYPIVSQSWQSLIIFSNAFAMAGSCLLCLFCISRTSLANWQRLQHTERRQKQTLHNIIPAKLCNALMQREIQQELGRENSHHIPSAIIEEHDFCSVVFADFSEFTRYCSSHPHAHVIKMLHEVFCTFDAIANRFQLEKIKTNGDQYMVIANSKLTLYEQAQIALAACQFSLAIKTWFQSQNFKPPMNIRIGIASGKSVSGIIGSDKPAYDLWGTTVNVAARLESQTAAGSISVCSVTKRLTEQSLLYGHLGQKELKGLGKIKYARLLGKR